MAEGNAASSLKEFFSTPEKPVTNAELIELKKADDIGYKQLREGLSNGSLTY